MTNVEKALADAIRMIEGSRYARLRDNGKTDKLRAERVQKLKTILYSAVGVELPAGLRPDAAQGTNEFDIL